jgi:hypothetical protein
MAQPDDQTAAFLKGALSQAGIEASPEELSLLVIVHGAFGRGLETLTTADLGAVPLEWDLDPSRAPR